MLAPGGDAVMGNIESSGSAVLAWMASVLLIASVGACKAAPTGVTQCTKEAEVCVVTAADETAQRATPPATASNRSQFPAAGGPTWSQ